MAKKPAIGHVTCHVCEFAESEVKLSDKSGLAFTFCPDCNVQSFARTKFQHDKLIAKMTPLPGQTPQTIEPQTVEAQAEAEAEAEKPADQPKKKFSLEDL